MRARRLSLSRLDALLLLFFAGVLLLLAHRLTTALHYSWNWGAIPQFLVRYDEPSGRWLTNYLLEGLLTTLRLSLWASLLALPLGCALALARIGPSLYLRLLATTFIELMRNLPPLVILFLLYYFLADQLGPLLDPGMAGRLSPFSTGLCTALFAPPASLAPFLAALVSLALFEAAYVAEILRAGIQSIHRGQWEACQVLGLSRRQSLCHIILPQGFRRALPPLAGQLVSLIKDSSIVSVLSIQELTYQGSQLMASTYLTFEVWLTVAGLYLLLTFPCSYWVERLNRRMNRLG